MRSIKVIHALLVLVGSALGFYATDEHFNDPMPWSLLLFAPVVAFFSCVVFLGVVVWLCSERLYSYIYWYIWLSAVLMLSVGLGLSLQAFFAQLLSATYFFTLVSSAGVFVGLVVIPMLARRRYAGAH